MKAVRALQALTGAACMALAVAASAQVTVTDSAAAKPSSGPTVGQRIDNGALTTKVKTALTTESNLKSLHIHVHSRNGVVRLSGSVPTDTQKSLAEQTAANVSGVKSVRNSLKVVAQ